MAQRRGLGKGEQPVRGEFLDHVAANIGHAEPNFFSSRAPKLAGRAVDTL